MKITHALIMAAGRGQRMMPLTDVVPKPMAPFNGSTLIADGISQLAQKIPNIHITVGYKGAMLAQHVIDCGVTSVFNTTGRGNSWWLYNTLLKHLDAPLLVLTCDNVVSLDLELLEENYALLDSPPGIVVPVQPIPGLDGDYIFRDKSLVTRLSRVESSDVYCSGIQILNPYKINQLTASTESFNEVWQQLIDSQLLHVSSVYPLRWYAVDTLEQLQAINKERSG